MSWQEFVKYALSPAGIGAIIGFLMTFLVEYWPDYDNLAPKWKRLAYFGLALSIPLVVTTLAIVTQIQGSWGDFQGTWWPALVAGFLAFSSGTLAHTRKL